VVPAEPVACAGSAVEATAVVPAEPVVGAAASAVAAYQTTSAHQHW
jgi:hypothetical protein